MLPHLLLMGPRCRAVNEESPAFRRGECQWHTRWRAKGSTNLRRLAVCSLAYDVAVDVCVVMFIAAVAFSIMQK